MEAIRDYCDNARDYDLTGCTLYTTAEPCLMCLGACLWANIDTVYYGASVQDTNEIGFRDDIFDQYLSINRDKLHESKKLVQVEQQGCLELFADYVTMDSEKY